MLKERLPTDHEDGYPAPRKKGRKRVKPTDDDAPPKKRGGPRRKQLAPEDDISGVLVNTQRQRALRKGQQDKSIEAAGFISESSPETTPEPKRPTRKAKPKAKPSKTPRRTT